MVDRDSEWAVVRIATVSIIYVLWDSILPDMNSLPLLLLLAVQFSQIRLPEAKY